MGYPQLSKWRMTKRFNGKGSIETQRFICGIFGNLWKFGKPPSTHRALFPSVEVLPRSCWNYCRNLRCLPSQLQGSFADSQRDRCKSGMLSPCHWLGVSALCSGFWIGEKTRTGNLQTYPWLFGRWPKIPWWSWAVSVRIQGRYGDFQIHWLIMVIPIYRFSPFQTFPWSPGHGSPVCILTKNPWWVHWS